MVLGILSRMWDLGSSRPHKSKPIFSPSGAQFPTICIWPYFAKLQHSSKTRAFHERPFPDLTKTYKNQKRFFTSMIFGLLGFYSLSKNWRSHVPKYIEYHSTIADKYNESFPALSESTDVSTGRRQFLHPAILILFLIFSLSTTMYILFDGCEESLNDGMHTGKGKQVDATKYALRVSINSEELTPSRDTSFFAKNSNENASNSTVKIDRKTASESRQRSEQIMASKDSNLNLRKIHHEEISQPQNAGTSKDSIAHKQENFDREHHTGTLVAEAATSDRDEPIFSKAASGLKIISMCTEDYAKKCKALAAALSKFGHVMEITAVGWSSSEPGYHSIPSTNQNILETKIDILHKYVHDLTDGYLLWIDSDSYVVGDVNKLVDRYSNCDFSATIRPSCPIPRVCNVAAGVMLFRISEVTKKFMSIASQHKKEYFKNRGKNWFQDQIALNIALKKSQGLKKCNLKIQDHFIGPPHASSSKKYELVEIIYSGRPIPKQIINMQRKNVEQLAKHSLTLHCVLPAVNEQEKMKVIKQTWGSQCDVLHFCFTPAEKALDGINEDMFDKLQNCYRNSRTKNEKAWVFKADLDTYANIGELKSLIRSLPRSNIFAGLRLTEPQTKSIFNSGGAGFLMSPDVVEKFVTSDTDQCKYSKNMLWTDARSRRGKYCDVRVANCLKSFGTMPLDTRDHGRERFHPYSKAVMKSLHKDKQSWYWTHSSLPKSSDIVSDHSITFHRLKPVEMTKYFEIDWCKSHSALPNGGDCSGSS